MGALHRTRNRATTMIPAWELALRTVLSALLGGLIGWERETRGKPLGFRTMILVSLAVTVYVLSAMQTAATRGEPVDAGRLMAGVAQGVGFLGAGMILHRRGQVRWLTTAAAMWAAAAVGLAVGMGQYLIAVLGAVLVFLTLRGLVVIEEHWLGRKDFDGD